MKTKRDSTNFGMVYGCKHNFVTDICINCLHTKSGIALGGLRENIEIMELENREEKNKDNKEYKDAII